MVVDFNSRNRDIRLILSDAGNNSLLVYNFSKQIWWRLCFRSLTESETGMAGDEPWQSGFNELALSSTNPTLYATSSQSPELYSIDMNEFRNLDEPLPYHWNVSFCTFK